MEALLDNYRSGHDFDQRRLVVDPEDAIIPYRTIFDGDRFTLRIDADDDGRPSARLGSRPWQSWASTWTRLSDHPLETNHNKYEMTLDANLRRLRSWSTALQYIEDYTAWSPDQ